MPEQTWTDSHGHLVAEDSTGDPTDFGFYRGQVLNTVDLAQLRQIRDDMDAVQRVLDVTDDVARRIVLRAHQQAELAEAGGG